MQFKDAQDLPINDFLRDDTLLKITDSNPWYANIVNFMLVGHVPPGANKKSSSKKAEYTNGMSERSKIARGGE